LGFAIAPKRLFSSSGSTARVGSIPIARSNSRHGPVNTGYVFPSFRPAHIEMQVGVASPFTYVGRCQLSVVRHAKSANLLAYPFENAHHGPIK